MTPLPLAQLAHSRPAATTLRRAFTAAASVALAAFLSPLHATEASPGESGARTVAEEVEFKTPEEYDAEAAARISGFTLPDDISASLFADESQIQNPSAICFDHEGRLYVAEIHRWRAGVEDIRHEPRLLLEDIAVQTNEDRLAMYERDQLSRPLSYYTEFEDRIVRLEDRSGDGRADHTQVWADGFNDVLDGPGIGLVAGPEGEIYYTNIPHLWLLRDTDGDGTADERTSLQDGFGVRISISGHDMHGIVWGPDGRLYWSIGDRGYSFTTQEGRHYHRPFEGAVFRCEPDGSNLEEIYRGLRNPQELAFDQYGNLFTCDNDADSWDKGRLVHIVEGGDSGWHHGHQVLLNFRNQLDLRTPDYDHPEHSRLPLNPWMSEGLWETLHPERPAHALPPVEIVSWGPSGLVYHYGAVAMPERYREHFWVCNFGGARGDLEAFTVKPQGAGFALDQHEVFMVGLGNTDVEFGPDGRIYLSCFNNNGWMKQDLGNIYVLEAKDPPNPELIAETESLLTAPFGGHDTAKLSGLLGHADMRVRQRAQFELASRGAAEEFLDALDQRENPLQRLHGVWGLGQISRHDDEAGEGLLAALVERFDDEDAEVRAQIAKTLADSRDPAVGEALAAALDDESPRVVAFAAIGVGKTRNVLALPRLLEILAENDNADVFLRHACVQGIWYLNEREKILRDRIHESAAVRLGILLALRKLEDPRVKYFLDDEEPAIRAEAIRAINDLDLHTALPALAETLESPLGDGALPRPEGHRAWILHTRAVNANFRVGDEAGASRLLAYAANAEVPELLREDALHALLEWDEPNPVDATTGHHRPLDPAARADISETVAGGIGAIFEHAEGSLVGLATRLALRHGAEAPVELLLAQILDAEAETADRVGSLEGLAAQEVGTLAEHWETLLSEEQPAALRAAAIGRYAAVAPGEALAAALGMAASDQIRHRQHGYRALSGFETEEAAAFFAGRLEDLGSEKPGVLLELFEAAESRREDSRIAALLDAHAATVDPADPMAVHRRSLHGGDPEKGRELFTTHAAGQCAKCHSVGGDGGVAGPDLSGIAGRESREYLLESLVNPNAVVVEGYGIMLMTLTNGETVGGAFLAESDDGVTLRLADPEDPHRQIDRTFAPEEIATRQPPVSAMPAANLFMTPAELRDLVAYLATLKEG